MVEHGKPLQTRRRKRKGKGTKKGRLEKNRPIKKEQPKTQKEKLGRTSPRDGAAPPQGGGKLWGGVLCIGRAPEKKGHRAKRRLFRGNKGALREKNPTFQEKKRWCFGERSPKAMQKKKKKGENGTRVRINGRKVRKSTPWKKTVILGRPWSFRKEKKLKGQKKRFRDDDWVEGEVAERGP